MLPRRRALVKCRGGWNGCTGLGGRRGGFGGVRKGENVVVCGLPRRFVAELIICLVAPVSLGATPAGGPRQLLLAPPPRGHVQCTGRHSHSNRVVCASQGREGTSYTYPALGGVRNPGCMQLVQTCVRVRACAPLGRRTWGGSAAQPAIGQWTAA